MKYHIYGMLVLMFVLLSVGFSSAFSQTNPESCLTGITEEIYFEDAPDYVKIYFEFDDATLQYFNSIEPLSYYDRVVIMSNNSEETFVLAMFMNGCLESYKIISEATAKAIRIGDV